MKEDWKSVVLDALNMPTDNVPKWSKEKQEEVYKHSYVLYQNGQYKEAAKFYTTLVYSNPFCARYWKGLAASQQMVRKLQEALHAWGIVAVLSERDPQPHLHAAECLLSLKEKEDAKKALKLAEERIKKEGHEPFKQRIKQLKEALNNCFPEDSCRKR